jgi:sugar/nucleoside kinase (ribokinase family)
MPEATFDVCVIGPVARDSNTVGTRELPPQPGGAAYYSTMVYAALGLRAAVVTRVAAADEAALLTELRETGVAVVNLPTRVSTSFRNLYDPADPDARRQRVDAIADPIRAADLPPLAVRIWQIGPLTRQEGDLDLVAHCAERGGLVAMDVQGFTREVVAGQVRPAPPAASFDELGRLAVLKADDAEILAYTGARAIAAAAAKVRAAGVREALVTYASRGSTIFGPDGRLEIAAVPPHQHVDPTGCGDTYLAAYMTRRLTTEDLRECGEFAAAVASLKIEHVGPFRGSAAEIAARMEEAFSR